MAQEKLYYPDEEYEDVCDDEFEDAHDSSNDDWYADESDDADWIGYMLLEATTKPAR